ncbi:MULTISPECIES: hypothetical protein [Burkholderia]|uniref:hypothetical protein n=1 Tax=Burkholderia TaxID=32008 RepID=UPI0011AFB74F|nr:MULTISPECIES: hypothetical protein [unclassified Burkholderia]
MLMGSHDGVEANRASIPDVRRPIADAGVVLAENALKPSGGEMPGCSLTMPRPDAVIASRRIDVLHMWPDHAIERRDCAAHRPR